ncbi:MAG: hypothetical protein QW176_05175 [Candidatus Bathyarchaeia archaeon]
MVELSGMLLSDGDIRLRVMNRSLVIEPFKDELVNPAGYDLRCGEALKMAPEKRHLTFTLEWIEVPLDLAGILSTFILCQGRPYRRLIFDGSRV